MNFFKWFGPVILPAEPLTTVSKRRSTSSTQPPTLAANTNEIGLNQCSAKLDSFQSLNAHAVDIPEQYTSENDVDQPVTEPKRVQSPKVQLVDKEQITRNDSIWCIAEYNPSFGDKPVRVVLVDDKVPRLLVIDYIKSCSFPNAQKHLFAQESKKAVMMAMLSDVSRDKLAVSLQGLRKK